MSITVEELLIYVLLLLNTAAVYYWFFAHSDPKTSSEKGGEQVQGPLATPAKKQRAQEEADVVKTPSFLEENARGQEKKQLERSDDGNKTLNEDTNSESKSPTSSAYVPGTSSATAADNVSSSSMKSETVPEEEKVASAATSNERAAKETINITENQSVKEGIYLIPLRILYATTTQTAKKFAERLQQQIFALNVSGHHYEVSIADLSEYDQDNLEQEDIVIYLMPTWTGGTPPASAKTYFGWLEDMDKDFRVSRGWLKDISFAVFGLGNKEYEEDWCKAAVDIQSFMSNLGAEELIDIGFGDDNVDMEHQFQDWSNELVASLCRLYTERTNADVENVKPEGGCGSGCGSSSQTGTEKPLNRKQRRKQRRKEKDESLPVEEEDIINENYLAAEDQENGDGAVGDGMVDLEDIANVMQKAKDSSKKEKEAEAPRNMVTPAQYRALTKEGYKIVGTHSAVKLCRWTKHQLRGRGGCYKHTFYGITSYQCMETTPSLACANKCVFCWRHHKNPVGREWRWKIDDPEEIVTSCIKNHQQMIKQMKGVPGVKMDRWSEAFNIRHCALSLVGEPIMYPYINHFVKLLHDRQISSFLVTNAQFPEAISSLDPVTQLYVSIDASTKDTLKAIDRPLFKDFWERFISSLDSLRDKGQRTVYRLTLVKSYNMDEVKNYCDLIRRGNPDLIEIKAVTYCGTSDGSDLTMKDVPFHQEVRSFCEAIAQEMGGTYGLACEHEHSNCVLLANRCFYRFPDDVDESGSTVRLVDVEDRFAHLPEGHIIRGNDTKDAKGRQGAWFTWIDYNRFHQLVQEYHSSDSCNDFTSKDYVARTPCWSVYNSKEQGFDPVEERFRRTKDGKVQEYSAPTEAGCG